MFVNCRDARQGPDVLGVLLDGDVQRLNVLALRADILGIPLLRGL
jgi:hypothetical protein